MTCKVVRLIPRPAAYIRIAVYRTPQDRAALPDNFPFLTQVT